MKNLNENIKTLEIIVKIQEQINTGDNNIPDK